jgi:hypothetical protein
MASNDIATEISANEELGQEVVVDCIAFFYEEGKGGENFGKKNKFCCKVKKEEKSLKKLNDMDNMNMM